MKESRKERKNFSSLISGKRGSGKTVAGKNLQKMASRSNTHASGERG